MKNGKERFIYLYLSYKKYLYAPTKLVHIWIIICDLWASESKSTTKTAAFSPRSSTGYVWILFSRHPYHDLSSRTGHFHSDHWCMSVVSSPAGDSFAREFQSLGSLIFGLLSVGCRGGAWRLDVDLCRNWIYASTVTSTWNARISSSACKLS